MKLRITKVLALMVICLMVIQVLPVSVTAEEYIEEIPAVEMITDTVQDLTDADAPAQEEPEGYAETIPEADPALEDTDTPDVTEQPEEDMPSTDLDEDITKDDSDSSPDEAATAFTDDIETDPIDSEVTDEEESAIQDDESDDPSESEPESEQEEDPETELPEETPDAIAVEDPDEIDYEAIEAEYDTEFDDIYESFPEMSLEDEVLILYNGSWIKYAIYNNDHAYVRIRHTTGIYSDTDLADEDLLCTISDHSVLLLATEHCQRWNTLSVHVWFMTPDMQMLDGYILEEDLVNEVFPDEEAFRLAASALHSEMKAGSLTLPVFAASVSIPEIKETAEMEENISVADSDEDPDDELIDEPQETTDEQNIADDQKEDAEATLDTDADIEEPVAPVLRNTVVKISRSASGLTDGQAVTVYRGDDLQRYVRAKDGTATTATYRHYVTLTVNGTAKNYDALCLNAKRSSSTSGFSATLINGADYNPLGTTLTEAQKAKADGMFWILLETNFTDPFDTAISQWAVWKYGGGTDYDSNVAKVSNIAAGKGFQYDTETMRAKINALIDGATSFVANGGVPQTTITVSASAVTRTAEGHSMVTIWINSNGSKCRIAKSQLLQSTISGYQSEDNTYYYFNPNASFTIDFTADALNFNIDAWSRYDQYEYWVGDVSSSSRQDMGFIVYTGGIGATTSLSVKAAKVYGSVRVLKRDADSGALLPGVTFEILNASRVRVASGTTDQNGVLLFTQLETGTYYVHEIAVPDGYELDDTNHSVNVTTANQTVDVTVQNHRIKGTIVIHKVEAGTGNPISGVSFDVIDQATGSKVCSVTTDSSGFAETSELPVGFYLLRETAAPQAYAVIQTDYPVTISGSQRHPETEIENELQLGAVRVIKRDSEDNQPISGVMFEILDSAQTVAARMTTDENGQATSSALPCGTYTIREASMPEGYLPSDTQQQVTINPNTTENLTFTNTPIRFRVEIIKTDGQTGEPLSGAEFTIVRKNGLPSHGNAGIGETVAVLVTGDDGKAVSELLTWGEYEITETKVPEHYLDSGFNTRIVGNENGKTYTIEVENHPAAGQIRIVKTDALDGQPIEGVTFDIYQDDQLVGSMTTDSNGVAVSEPLPQGRYIVKEHDNPEGYVHELFTAECDVAADGITNLNATNQPLQLRIEIVKTDSLTHQPLPGAVFTIVRKSGLPSHGGEGDNQIVAVLVTGDDGRAVSDLLTWGEYIITETGVPDGYIDEGYTATAKFN